jgi:hypothetical protein
MVSFFIVYRQAQFRSDKHSILRLLLSVAFR